MVHTVASFGFPVLFASRVFIPAFAAALMLRLGLEQGWETGAFAALSGDAPSWFISSPCIAVLGILALCELLANRSQDARELLAMTDQYGKPLVAAMTYMGFLSVGDAAFVQETLQFQEAGVVSTVFAGGIAIATYILASWRGSLLGQIHEVDEDNDSGILGVFSWVEDLFSFFGVFLLILFPILMLIALAMIGGGLYLIKTRARRREDAGKLSCGGCGNPVYRAALACPSCQSPNPAPAALTWLGVASELPARDPDAHRFLLAMAKRCPCCAERLAERHPIQTCAACGSGVFASPAFAQSYDQALMRRLPTVLLVCAALGLVPVAGLLAGIVYYQFQLVGPLRRYIPRGQAFMLRWGMRFLLAVLLSIQLIPFMGIVALPTMAAVNFFAYRAMFLRLCKETSAGTLVPEPAPVRG